ncbi:YcxB family protein [Novosphingobium soli]|uniref:YcxB family protein n=1 Tax=Novosphingobium soli TaxID=574956 RepID=A0ABV6CX88_9SPHN
MSGQFTITLDFDEYLAANWLMVRRRMLWRGAAKFVATTSVLYSLMFIAIRFVDEGPSLIGALSEMATGVALALVVMAVLGVYWRWCIPRSARKTWPQLHLDGLPTHHEFDNRGIRIANELGSSNLEWQMLSSWTEDERLLLMFRTKAMFHAVPKAQVPADRLAALRAELVRAGVATRC